MMVYLPTVITFNISLFLVTIIAENLPYLKGWNLAGDLKDEGGR